MVAVQLWRDCEEIPHVQGKRSPSKTVGAGVATAWRWSDFGEIPHVQGERRNTSKMVGRGKVSFRIKPHSCQDAQRAQTNLVHTRTQRPHRD